MGSPTTREGFPRKKSKEWSVMLRSSRLRTTSRRTGFLPRMDLRVTASTRSRRRLRVFATPSSPSCMRTLEVLQEACPEECLTWEAWEVHQVLEPLEELAVLVLPSRRSTNRTELRMMTSQSLEMG